MFFFRNSFEDQGILVATAAGRSQGLSSGTIWLFTWIKWDPERMWLVQGHRPQCVSEPRYSDLWPRTLCSVPHQLNLISLQDTSSTSPDGSSPCVLHRPSSLPLLCPCWCHVPAQRAFLFQCFYSNLSHRTMPSPAHFQCEGSVVLLAQINLFSLWTSSGLFLFCFMLGLNFPNRLLSPMSKFLSSALWSSWHLLPG